MNELLESTTRDDELSHKMRLVFFLQSKNLEKVWTFVIFGTTPGSFCRLITGTAATCTPGVNVPIDISHMEIVN